jgi:hypothetical protein
MMRIAENRSSLAQQVDVNVSVACELRQCKRRTPRSQSANPGGPAEFGPARASVGSILNPALWSRLTITGQCRARLCPSIV